MGEPVDVKRQIRSIVGEAISAAGVDVDLTDSLSLLDSGLLDSLSIVYVVQGIQNQFEIDLDFADITLEQFDSIDVIAELIERRSRSNE